MALVVMSYFAQDNYAFGDTYDYVLTPQMADIYAVQPSMAPDDAYRQYHLRL